MFAIITLIIELLLLALITSLGTMDVGNTLASVFILLFSVTLIPSVQGSKNMGKYSTQILLGYILRLTILFFDIFGQSIYVLPQADSDARMFYRTSRELVLYGRTDGRGYFISLMYTVLRYIGVNRLYGQFLLMLLSILALIIYLKTIDGLCWNQMAKDKSAWIMCLLPNFALLSSMFLRESLVMLLITISGCCMVKWMKNAGRFPLIMAFFTSIIACLFHSGSIGITIGCIFCMLIFDRHNQRIHVTPGSFVISVFFAGATTFLFLQYGKTLMAKFLKIDSLEDIANVSSLGGSNYSRYVGNSSNPLNMIIYTIPRIVYFLFSPFPWQWRGLSDIIAFFFSGLFYLITIINSITYLRRCDQHHRSIVIGLISIVFFCTFIFSWGTSNTGTATRHRDKMVLLYGLLYCLTLHSNKTNPSENKGGSIKNKYIKV
ncbi:MAG: hypothetical protein IKR85_07720 [Clostridia bacterium]|nr:hypothetical protein [Clostridia bacterium]